MLRSIRPYTAFHAEVDGRLLEALAALDRQAIHVAHAVALLEDRSQRQEVVVRELIDAAAALLRRTEDLGQRLSAQTEALDQIGVQQRDLRAQLETVPYMSGEPFTTFQAPVGHVTGYTSVPWADEAPSPYAGFEDLFRGPAERVSELQRDYLPLVRDRQPVLDVGCGRGEFLTLLATEGIAARGVDSDAGMVDRCRAQGLPAELGDGIELLATLDEASLGTVFCAQVIEHLPVQRLQRLLELARTRLSPGGLFIAETVNPHSLAGMKTFWVDLTHQHPIFPEVALALCALAGFPSAYVFAPGHESFEAARFRSNTYAVVATAPHAERPVQ